LCVALALDVQVCRISHGSDKDGTDRKMVQCTVGSYSSLTLHSSDRIASTLSYIHCGKWLMLTTEAGCVLTLSYGMLSRSYALRHMDPCIYAAIPNRQQISSDSWNV